MVRVVVRAAVVSALILSAAAKPKKRKGDAKVNYWQNCAARKKNQCHIPYPDRDPHVHDAPEGTPKGHLKPFGHPDFMDTYAGELDRHKDMHPDTFWNKYVWNGLPFVLEGWAKKSETVWNKYTVKYMMEKFGNFTVKTEARNEDRLSDYCGMEKMGEMIYCPEDLIPYEEKRASLFTFLNRSLNEPNYDKYAISEMPLAMAEDFIIPTMHMCGTKKKPQEDRKPDRPWETNGYESNIFFSMNPPGEHTTSTVHFDMNHQIMCTFSGTKEWILWDSNTELKHFPMFSGNYKKSRHGTWKSDGSDDSPIDGERVDLVRWPDVAKAKWWRANMEPGDCIFLPAMALHYVRTIGDLRPDFYGMSMSMMQLFQTSERFDKNGCWEKDEDKPEPFSLASVDNMWSYPEEHEDLNAWGHIKMGYPNWKQEKLYPFSKRMKKLTRNVTKADLLNGFSASMQQLKYPKKKARLDKAWADYQAEGNFDGTQVCKSRAIRHLIKDICALEAGGITAPIKDWLKPGYEWTARLDYTLSGDRATVKGAKHGEEL